MLREVFGRCTTSHPLAYQLTSAGRDVIHTSQLKDGNRTTDLQIAMIADDQKRVIVTKDRDFRDAHLLKSSPRNLLLIDTGNISNNDLLALFDKNFGELVKALGEVRFVELRHEALILHADHK